MSVSPESRPALALGARLQFDDVRGEHTLLFPEGAVKLNPTAVEVLELCDGTRTVAGIVAVLQERYPGADLGADVHELIGEIAEQRLIILD